MGKCSVCGASSDILVCMPEMCMPCARDLYAVFKDTRTRIVNEVMQTMDKEADDVLKSDPTRGRGRGPKWLD